MTLDIRVPVGPPPGRDLEAADRSPHWLDIVGHSDSDLNPENECPEPHQRLTGWEEGLVPAVAWPGNYGGDKSLFLTCYWAKLTEILSWVTGSRTHPWLYAGIPPGFGAKRDATSIPALRLTNPKRALYIDERGRSRSPLRQPTYNANAVSKASET